MNLPWIIAALLVIGVLAVLHLAGPLKGSSSADFSEKYQPENNPLPSCTNSANCVLLSIETESGPDSLYRIAKLILKEMGVEIIKTSSQSLQLTAVFQIPVFGFRDDFSVQITSSREHTGAVLHLLSRSRIGRSDLGVNRRRVKAFIHKLNNHI